MKMFLFGTLALTAAAATPAAALPLDRGNGVEMWARAVKHSVGVCNTQGRCWNVSRHQRVGRHHVVYHQYYVENYGETFYVRR